MAVAQGVFIVGIHWNDNMKRAGLSGVVFLGCKEEGSFVHLSAINVSLDLCFILPSTSCPYSLVVLGFILSLVVLTKTAC